MPERRWAYFFVRTDAGLRSRRLRDYDWNERVAFLLLALVIVGLALARSL